MARGVPSGARKTTILPSRKFTPRICPGTSSLVRATGNQDWVKSPSSPSAGIRRKWGCGRDARVLAFCSGIRMGCSSMVFSFLGLTSSSWDFQGQACQFVCDQNLTGQAGSRRHAGQAGQHRFFIFFRCWHAGGPVAHELHMACATGKRSLARCLYVKAGALQSEHQRNPKRCFKFKTIRLAAHVLARCHRVHFNPPPTKWRLQHHAAPRTPHAHVANASNCWQ